MSDSEIFEECPLCLEEIDILDSNFKPCPCGYQICMFCYQKICSDNKLCPACRRIYTEEGIQNDPVTPKQIAKAKARKTQKETPLDTEYVERKILPNSRVEQKNLVYVLGFSNKYCNPDLLRKNDYFGQFGTITKLIISPRNKVGNQSSFAVYVTYQTSEEAARAIAALDGSEVDGKFLKACYGTTKYCANFLKQLPCTNPTCLYLHEITKDSEYAVSASKFALKPAMSPFTSHSSEAKRSERRSNVNRGFSVNMKDLRGSALPATASWAKGPGSSLDIGSKSSGDVAMDFPALLPVRHESNHKPSAKRKEWQESSREPIALKPKSPSPAPDEEDFYENLQMDTLTPGTKTPGDTTALTVSVPLSDHDIAYSSEEEKEEQMLSEQDDSEWEQLPPELRVASPSRFIDSERETESISASNERAAEKRSEMIQIQRVQSASEDHSNFFFPLEVSLDPVPNSPRLEFGRSQQFETGASRFGFAQHRHLTPLPALPIEQPPQSWDAGHYVEGLLSSPELPPFDQGSNISIQDLFLEAAKLPPPPRFPQAPQQLPPKQKLGSRFFKTKPQTEPQVKQTRYPPHYAIDPPQVVYPVRPVDLEHDERAQLHVPVHEAAYSVPRHPYPELPLSHFYDSQPRFFPVPEEPNLYLPQSDSSLPFKDLLQDYPNDVARYPQSRHSEPRQPFHRSVASDYEFRDVPYQRKASLGFQAPLQEYLHEPIQQLIQEFPPVPKHQLKLDFSTEKPAQDQQSVPETVHETVVKEEEIAGPREEVTIEGSELAAQVETIAIEPVRPPTPPPMPKLAFDHFPAFRSSLDKPLSGENSLLIQKELSSIYSLLQAAIENKSDSTPAGTEKIKRLEATALMIQEKPLTEFSPLNAHSALMKGVQTALRESSSLSEHLRNLSEKFDYKFDMNFEL